MTKETSRSGPSGKHRTARYLLTLSAVDRKIWGAAAKLDGRTLAEWIRTACREKAQREMPSVPAHPELYGPGIPELLAQSGFKMVRGAKVRKKR